MLEVIVDKYTRVEDDKVVFTGKFRFTMLHWQSLDDFDNIINNLKNIIHKKLINLLFTVVW